jgi:hypothetical protein
VEKEISAARREIFWGFVLVGVLAGFATVLQNKGWSEKVFVLFVIFVVLGCVVGGLAALFHRPPTPAESEAPNEESTVEYQK